MKSQTEENSDSRLFCYGTKCFKVITALNLKKPFCNQSGFMPSNSHIRIFLKAKYPFTTNSLFVGRKMDQSSSTLFDQGSVFLLHGSSPCTGLRGLLIGLRLSKLRRGEKTLVQRFRPSDHGMNVRRRIGVDRMRGRNRR